MKQERIVEEMAKLDGHSEVRDIIAAEYDPGSEWWMLRRKDGCMIALGDYPNSHDAVQPVIEGLDSVLDYCSCLNEEVADYPDLYEWDAENMALATPAQKCEAILKAKGLWEDGE